MRPRSLDHFLKEARVPFTTFRHAPAFTAQEEAAVSHVPGRCWAKTVVCFADNAPILAVLPAYLMVDFDALRQLAGAGVIRLASEQTRQLEDLARSVAQQEPVAGQTMQP